MQVKDISQQKTVTWLESIKYNPSHGSAIKTGEMEGHSHEKEWKTLKIHSIYSSWDTSMPFSLF